MIALSTSWYPRSKATMGATLEAIAGMGFKAIEVGVADPFPFRLKKLQKLLARTQLKVVSLHNVCCERKLDPTNRRGDWLASPDEAKRREGVAVTLETIENAKALGASAVVLHLGSLPIEEKWGKQSVLYHIVHGGPRAEASLGISRRGILAEREPLAPAHLEAACRSLAELLARSAGIRLGIECRMGWHELPSLAELGAILDRFPDPRVGYWHDVGHAVIQDFLGLANQYEWLHRHGRRTIGLHLHDVQIDPGGPRDHYPPGLGQVDLELLAGLVPAGALCVMEIAPGFHAEAVALGRRRLEEMGLCS